MFQINDRLLDPLLEKIVLGKPLAKALINEAYQEIGNAKSTGQRPRFREILSRVVRRHSQELKGSDDFHKASLLVSKYFSACRKIRKEKDKMENQANQAEQVDQEQLSIEKHPAEQLEMFQSDSLRLVDKKKIERILIEDYLIEKYYHKRP